MYSLGKVYLVGAGTGNLDYLTVRGKELLSSAEVLIYDALVDEQLLTCTNYSCLNINVGKRGGKVSTPQTKINQLLVNYCQQGKQVVRLKSGDPLVFGRIMPEIDALKAASCDYELVPGISSALFAPMQAGIPLTDKNLSRGFAVISGHQPDLLNWQSLAGIDTLVILMGGRTLKQIVTRLQLHGCFASTPIAIIRNCSRPEQEIFWGTLTDIVEKTGEINLSPAVIVIGKVVSLSDNYPYRSIEESASNLQPATVLPLATKTLLVTRAAGQSSKFTTLLQQQGASVIEMPALVITPPSSWEGLDRALVNIQDFQWLILTSANAVNYFFERLASLNLDIRTLAGIKIAVVGKKTAAVLKQKQLQPDFIPPNFVADSLVTNFPEPLNQQKILFPRVETGGRDILVKELTAQGAKIVEVAAYQSQCPQQIDLTAWQALQQKQVDVITFASSKTVRNFANLITSQLAFDSEIVCFLENIAIASIGPQTSQTCHKLLGRVDIEAQEYTLEGLTQAISNYFATSA